MSVELAQLKGRFEQALATPRVARNIATAFDR
jgi:hypothetical protein